MLGKGFHGCFSRLKRPSHSTPPLSPDSSHYDPSTTTTTTTTSSVSSTSFVFKNFNSLYDPAASDFETLMPTLSSSVSLSAATATATANSSFSSSVSAADEVAAMEGSPSGRDLSTAIASRRFFPASPGRSNSIVDSAAVGVGAGIAVPTYSPDPYWDFRRSMEEMVAALGLDPRAHLAHLHELLLCYLALNRKQAHKYIVGAFADLLLCLASTSTSTSTSISEEEGGA
ncbi:uncharacterized protein [Typha angustifolia]|uniref:uncharacterized protein n=1 Tax=Typha angustifolia TaxID=59011 RepID=UPI003C2E65E9